jgi:hypothetical protein
MTDTLRTAISNRSRDRCISLEIALYLDCGDGNPFRSHQAGDYDRYSLLSGAIPPISKRDARADH